MVFYRVNTLTSSDISTLQKQNKKCYMNVWRKIFLDRLICFIMIQGLRSLTLICLHSQLNYSHRNVCHVFGVEKLCIRKVYLCNQNQQTWFHSYNIRGATVAEWKHTPLPLLRSVVQTSDLMWASCHMLTDGRQFTVQSLDQLYVSVFSAHKTTRHMTCTYESDVKPLINK